MKKILIILMSSAIFIASCSGNRSESLALEFISADEEEASSAELIDYKTREFEKSEKNESGAFISSSAATETNIAGKKFIRKADIKFKTKNVIRTAYRIEDIVAKHGGFVARSSVRSENASTSSIRVSKDSVMEITCFTMTSDMILRVPAALLDTVLKEIAPLVDYMDYRTVTADDVSLSLLRNSLADKRLSKYGRRMADAAAGNTIKSSNVIDAEDRILSAEEQADNARLSNMLITDQIEYGTVSLQIYQSRTIKKELVKFEPDSREIEYTSGLVSRLGSAFVTGWDILSAILVFLIQIWGILLFVGVLIFAFVYFGRRKTGRPKKMPEPL